MPSDPRITKNFHEWLRTTYVNHIPKGAGNSPAAIYKHMKPTLERRLKEIFPEQSTEHTLKLCRNGFTNTKEVMGGSGNSIRLLVGAFSIEGLTRDILLAEPTHRMMFVVLANVTLVHPYTMGLFLQDTFDESPFIESACSVYGNHDCIFNVWASHEEMQTWLWETLRKDKTKVSDIRTQTYQTYSDYFRRFDIKSHPDYLKVHTMRLEHSRKLNDTKP